MRKRSMKLGAALVALGFLATACSEEVTTDAATTVAAPVTTAGVEPAVTEAPAPTQADTAVTEAVTADTEAPAPTEAAGPDVNAWALEYTGGTAGAASGEPYKIGYVNQEDFFPENTIGINAASDVHQRRAWWGRRSADRDGRVRGLDR